MSTLTKPSTSPLATEEPPDNKILSPGSSKPIRLNPNAQEFVPSSAKSGASSNKVANLDRTSSNNSNASDDEYRQFWRSQLPDDLISDSDFTTGEVYSDTNQLDQRDFDFRTGRRANGSYSIENPGGDLEQTASTDEIHPLTLLATEFPNFAVQSLSDIYYANGCDLGLTIEMLTQLELQEEGAPSRRVARPAAAPSLTPLDFPSLPGVELINGLSGHQETRRPIDIASLSRRFEQGIDFATVVRKQVAHQQQQPSHWPFERSPGDITIGSRSSVPTLSAYGYSSRVPPQPWLETGEAVANMYNDMREEARDHARVRNAYFEQARQAYLVGNKALAKELSAKGQWHNEQMKAAHGKAAEAIFHQRNSSLLQLARDGQSRMIDLHGLHVNEAIPLLRRELAAMRAVSRATSKRQCVFICVGTGHHTKGARTPARVPIAIERYLAEDERLPYSEVQPGMLRVFVQ